MNDKIHHVPNGTYALVAQLDRVTDYESVGRGFESLPSHQEKPEHVCVLVFLFCLRDGRGSNRAAAHSAASNQPSGLLLSPRVPTRRNVYRGSCKSKDFMAFLFCKPWVHGFCTVFARSVFSMSDYVGRCIALQSVPFFASGEQGQAELCLHFRVGIFQQFQESRHGDGGFDCGGYSLRAARCRVWHRSRFQTSCPALHRRTAGYERRCSPAYPHWRVL